MTSLTTKSALLALATAALLSAGASAASAQEFTLPAGDAGVYTLPARNVAPVQGRPEFSALFQGRSAAVTGDAGYSADQWAHNGGVAVQTR
jgi:opacity protein-like surface antigen